MVLDRFYVHTATVEQYLGSSTSGPRYAAGVSISCYIDAQQVETQAASGQTVTQRATVLYCDNTHAALLVPLSRVTSAQLGGDQTAHVQTCNPLDAGSLGLPNHVEAVLV